MLRRLAPVLFAVILAGFFAAFVSCATLTGKHEVPSNLDAGAVPDAGPAAEIETGPHEIGDCHPTPGATGNELHVGAYCTPGGHQCEAYPKGTATSCASDLSDKGGNFCIKLPCTSREQCGQGACCHGNALVKACVPIGCFAGNVCPN